jgi:hypothetical protein
MRFDASKGHSTRPRKRLGEVPEKNRIQQAHELRREAEKERAARAQRVAQRYTSAKPEASTSPASGSNLGIIGVTLGAIIVVFALFIVFGEESAEERRSAPPQRAASTGARSSGSREASVAEGLALIQTGRPANPDDPLVRHFARQLELLRAKCPETERRLADYAVSSQRQLAEEGIRATLADVMEEAGRIASSSGVGLSSCADPFALYVFARIKG